MLATYLRAGGLSRWQAEALLGEAEQRVYGLVNLPHVQASGGKLVTEDARLLKVAPALTQTIAQALR